LENKNLWAPWRIKYIQGLNKGGECFICEVGKTPDEDDKNFVLWRSAKSIVILNRFPYNNGHLLISPLRHIPDLETTSDDEMLELMILVRECQKALTLAIAPHGFNIGMNFGRCAGAGLPGHLHIHLVPRWDGDTNFMAVCSDTDVVSQSMTELIDLLKKVSKEHNLPNL
jgi:ATP adenylyltransferase